MFEGNPGRGRRVAAIGAALALGAAGVGWAGCGDDEPTEEELANELIEESFGEDAQEEFESAAEEAQNQTPEEQQQAIEDATEQAEQEASE